MQWIDTHIHIYSTEFDADRPLVISRAIKSGVSHFLMPNVDASTTKSMMDLAMQYPGICLPMAALHPTSVNLDYKNEIEIVEQNLDSGKFIAVGETGLDMYWDDSYFAQQTDAFRSHIEFAIHYKLPLVIHSRNALQPIFDVMADYRSSDLRGVFHCFPGDIEQAKKVLDMGFYIGAGGVVTYKNGLLAKVVEYVGLQQIILETDAPYLAPVPFRGKRNEPSYIEIIGKRVAEVTGTTLAQTAMITTSNAAKLFHLEIAEPVESKMNRK